MVYYIERALLKKTHDIDVHASDQLLRRIVYLKLYIKLVLPSV